MKIQCFTYELLMKYGGGTADQRKLRKLLEILKVDLQAKYPVTQHMLHNDTEVRCVVVVTKSGEELHITLPIEDFNKLPTEEVPPELLE